MKIEVNTNTNVHNLRRQREKLAGLLAQAQAGIKALDAAIATVAAEAAELTRRVNAGLAAKREAHPIAAGMSPLLQAQIKQQRLRETARLERKRVKGASR